MSTEREERLNRRTELIKAIAKQHMFDGDYSRFESALEAALAAEPRQETAPCTLEFNLSQAKSLLEMFGGDDTLISVTKHDGVLKAWSTEYSDEGSIILGQAAP